MEWTDSLQSYELSHSCESRCNTRTCDRSFQLWSFWYLPSSTYAIPKQNVVSGQQWFLILLHLFQVHIRLFSSVVLLTNICSVLTHQLFLWLHFIFNQAWNELFFHHWFFTVIFIPFGLFWVSIELLFLTRWFFVYGSTRLFNCSVVTITPGKNKRTIVKLIEF